MRGPETSALIDALTKPSSVATHSSVMGSSFRPDWRHKDFRWTRDCLVRFLGTARSENQAERQNSDRKDIFRRNPFWRHGKPFRNRLFCFISGLHRTMTGSIAGFLALLLVHPAPRFGSADLSLERRRE